MERTPPVADTGFVVALLNRSDTMDSRIDFVDACVMAVAERFGSTKILTLDQRDFRLFRPRHCNSFEILP